MLLLSLLTFFGAGIVVTTTNIVGNSFNLTGETDVSSASIVRINNDVIAIGSPYDDLDGIRDVGSVSVYSKTSKKLVGKIFSPENSTVGGMYGISLALNDKFLVVGCPHCSGRQASDHSGAVYAYEHKNGKLMPSVQRIYADDGTTNSEFGFSVGIHGNTIVVGARYANVSGSRSGSAYVFTHDGSTWLQKQRLGTSRENELLGSCVAISNKYIAVASRGSVHIFHKPYTGTWIEQTVFAPPYLSNSSHDNNLAVSGSRVVIGADNGGAGEGRAYIYSRQKGAWVLTGILKSNDSSDGNRFGYSVATDEQMILIGSHNSTNGGKSSGCVYGFEKIEGNWTQVAKFVRNEDRRGVHFGTSVGVDGGVVVVVSTDFKTTSQVFIFNELDNFIVHCSPTHVTGIWRRGQFSGKLKIQLDDPTCKEFTGLNDTHIWISTRLDKCQTKNRYEGDYLVFVNTAAMTITSETYGVGGTAVERDSLSEFEMRCRFDRYQYKKVRQGYNVTRPDPVFPTIVNETSVSADDFNTTINLYTNKFYVEEAFSPITVAMTEPLFVGIHEQHINPDYKFTVRDCYAKPMEFTVSDYSFFFDGCPIDQSNQWAVSLQNGTHFRFQIGAFRFISLSKKVMIVCRLVVCKSSSKARGCVQACADDATASQQIGDGEPPLKEVIAMSPEITFEEKETCATKSCPGNSTCYEIFPATCRCNHGYVRNFLTDTCNVFIKLELEVTTESEKKDEERSIKEFDDVISKITNIVLNKPFVAAYKNTSSVEFLQLARDAEQQLEYYIKKLNDPSIVGIKVIGATAGSVVLDILILRSANVTAEKALDVLQTAVNVTEREQVIANRTTNETANLAVPRFLGISVRFQEDETPVLVVEDVPKPVPSSEYDDTILVLILVPLSFLVLLICFVIFVTVISKRTQMHYRFE